MVDDRNRLGHGLLGGEGFDLSNDQSCRECITFLDRQHQTARADLLSLRDLGHQLLAAMLRIYGSHTTSNWRA